MMFIEYLYDGANLFALPFWALMVLLPGWSLTRRVMGSTLMFVPLALAYIYCFAYSLAPASVEASWAGGAICKDRRKAFGRGILWCFACLQGLLVCCRIW